MTVAVAIVMARTMNMLTMLYWAIDEKQTKNAHGRMYVLVCLAYYLVCCTWSNESMRAWIVWVVILMVNRQRTNSGEWGKKLPRVRINRKEYPIKLGYYKNKSRPLNWTYFNRCCKYIASCSHKCDTNSWRVFAPLFAYFNRKTKNP